MNKDREIEIREQAEKDGKSAPNEITQMLMSFIPGIGLMEAANSTYDPPSDSDERNLYDDVYYKNKK